MLRVSDYIAQTLVRHGIRHVFMVTGGGAMHLNDAFGRCAGLEYVCCHHEQACAMAAESYCRLTNRLAAVNVTTGPGGINAMNGVFGAYTDSIGMVVVSGQVRYDTVVRGTGLPLRQLGDQEVDIVRLVEPITKYAVMITDPATVRYHLEKALFLASSGRPGPVWLDVPMNVQGALIDPQLLPGFDASELPDEALRGAALRAVCEEIGQRLQAASRPVIMAGSGVRIAGAQAALLRLAQRWSVPLVGAWNAYDLVPNDHPCYAGRPGTIGDRAGNFTVQNSDFLLVLGSRLNIRQISYNWGSFARQAFKAIVDIDPWELKKPTLAPDLAVHADAAAVLDELLAAPAGEIPPARGQWLHWCRERVRRYPVVEPRYWDAARAVNPYCFMQALFEQLEEDEVVVCGDGTACVTSFQAAHIKAGQRLYTNSGCASMGYDLPAVIGAALGAAAVGRPLDRIICLAGDGSIMMNLQELQTIVSHRLPVKIFVLNNRGYHSIRQTQGNYFPDNIVGCGEESGLSFPSFEKQAAAYGLPYFAAYNHEELRAVIAAALAAQGAVMCEIHLDLTQQFAPKLASRRLADGRMVSSPLEDLAPFLDREELLSNLLIEPMADSM